MTGICNVNVDVDIALCMFKGGGKCHGGGSVDNGSAYKKTDSGNGKASFENDRYKIDINEANSQIKVTDKQDESKSFRIHGDPHVDIGNDGDTDFDFKKDMTIDLEDGTKLHLQTTPSKHHQGETLSSSLAIEEPDGSGWNINGIDSNQKGDLNFKEFDDLDDSNAMVDKGLEMKFKDGQFSINSSDGWQSIDENNKGAMDKLISKLENAVQNQPDGIGNKDDFWKDFLGEDPKSGKLSSEAKEMLNLLRELFDDKNEAIGGEKSNDNKEFMNNFMKMFAGLMFAMLGLSNMAGNDKGITGRL